MTNATVLGVHVASMPSPIPGDNSVFQTFRLESQNVPDDASFGNVDARWEWISTKHLPAFRVWSDANGAIDVATLLSGGYKRR